jgi:hypothetical protein
MDGKYVSLRICRTILSLISLGGPKSTGISTHGREPALPSQSGPERSVSVDDGSPLHAYVPKAVPPTPVEEEGPSVGTGIMSGPGGMSPRTSPTAPIRTLQPEHRDLMQLPSGLTPSLSRGHSTQTHQSSNAAPAPAAPSTADSPPKENITNVFCCGSNLVSGHCIRELGVYPGHFGIISLPTHFCKPYISNVTTIAYFATTIAAVAAAASEIINESSCQGFAIIKTM